jgi:hypothetical protein
MNHEAYYHRESVAKRDLGGTEVSPTVAGTLVALFLLSVMMTPAWHLIGWIYSTAMSTGQERVQPLPSNPPEGLMSNRVGPNGIAQTLDTNLPTVFEATALPDRYGTRWQRLIQGNQKLSLKLSSMEQRLNRQLWPVSFFQPLQPAMVRLLGMNTRSVCPGNDQWLFYKPDIDHLTGLGFLEPESKSPPMSMASKPNNPVVAILNFDQQLAARGIRLVIMPIPAKPAVHPEAFSRRLATVPEEALQNSSFVEFCNQLEFAGVPVFDISSRLTQRAKNQTAATYLKTDTHWSPESVVMAAELLAEWININLSDLQLRSEYFSQPWVIQGRGDLASILCGNNDSQWYNRESVIIRQITSTTGDNWQPLTGEILLLGDSFTNIYSMPEMNWGESAGFAEQLSFILQRPVDRIAQNHDGAIATRRSLARALAQQPERFQQTKVLIWQFAARELSFGNWYPVDLPVTSSTETSQFPSPRDLADDESAGMMVDATILSTAIMPEPGRVPYRDALMAVSAELKGSLIDNNSNRCVIYVWALKDNQPAPAAKLSAGQRIQLRLSDWTAVEGRLGRYARAELEDQDLSLMDLPLYYGEMVE